MKDDHKNWLMLKGSNEYRAHIEALTAWIQSDHSALYSCNTIIDKDHLPVKLISLLVSNLLLTEIMNFRL